MEKILVPIDGSLASKKAAEVAIEKAKHYGSKVTFLSIADIPQSYRYGVEGVSVSDEVYGQLVAGLIEQQTNMLDAFMAKIDCTGILHDKKVLTGEPYHEIVKFANETNSDLIVMGRRGFSSIKRFFVGSVTQRVISDAPCPVLVVNEQEK